MRIKTIKHKLLGRLSTDIALRYLPVVDILDKLPAKEKNQILEVGSGDRGITDYYRQRVTGLDVAFGPDLSPRLEAVEYGGGAFPLPDRSCDIALSVDSLEHIPPESRPQTVREMFRVARRGVIIVIPAGKDSEAQDRRLSALYRSHYGRTGLFFEDHLNFGLPSQNGLESMVARAAADAGRRIKIVRHSPLLNLRLRALFMYCQVSPSLLLSAVYYLFLALIPCRRLLNFGCCYRRLLYAKITG